MKRTVFLVLLCLCLILGACFATALADDTITIKTADDLVKFAADCETYNHAGKTVVLANNIDLGDANWTPIKSFAGTFDGNGKTISNFKIISRPDTERYGFFHVIEAGDTIRVHDLTLENVTASVGNGRFGTLANSIQGIVENVTVKNVTVTTTHKDAWVGGMCAVMSWPAMKNCTVENLTVNATQGAEFVSGYACILQKNSNYTFENLHVKGFTATVSDSDNACGIAGFVGQTQRGWEFPKLYNCSATGIDITATGTVDIGGFITWPGAHTTLDNCRTEGTIDATGVTSGYAGGFFGDLGWNCDLGQMGHKVSNCTANVNILTKTVPAGGFIGSATNSNNDSMYAEFTGCTANGNVTCVSGGTASVGGFAGVADRGHYTNCVSNGLVSGSVAGGFIGTVKDVKPAYDYRYPAGTRSYDANEIQLNCCTAKGTVLGTEKVGGLIGLVEKSLNSAAKGAAGKLIVTGCTTAPAVIGANKSTETDYYMNSVANSKVTEKQGLSGHRTIGIPTDASATLSMDQKGNVTIPEGGANVQHTDDLELEWIPSGSIIHRDGSITLPGSGNETASTPPQTGVNGVEGYALLATLSLLCMATLVTLRRKENHM